MIWVNAITFYVCHILCDWCFLYTLFSYYTFKLLLMLMHGIRYHPDKNANDPKAADMFKEVTFSYNILSDPDKRRQYDTAGFEVRYAKEGQVLL